MTDDIRSRLELSEVICNKIKPLCEPLDRVFGIPLFGYRKFFPDGTCFNTSSNVELTKFVQEKFSNKMLPNYEEEAKSGLQRERYFVLRVGEPSPQDLFLSALYDYDVWNTLSLYRKDGECLEGFYFTSTRKNYKIVEEYINNIGLFERFSYYFREKFSDILSAEDIKKVSLPTVSASIFEDCNKLALEKEKSFHDFIAHTFPQKLSLNINGKEVPLSSQEFKCLAWLSRGKTAKEAARMMGLSPRTVESYMDNVRFKTKIDSRSKLIDLFILNFCQERDLLKHMENNSKGGGVLFVNGSSG
jgi:DNA-binding CsgD family transcriptional regulator